MRYGHQPFSDLMDMHLDDLYALAEEISEIVRLENDTGRSHE